MAQPEKARYVVQRFLDFSADHEDRWTDVWKGEASDAGEALNAAIIRNPEHRIEATTYRVAEEALTVSVSINLEATDG